jgi:hypothetical protein
MPVIHYLRYWFVIGYLFTLPSIAFSQSSDIEVDMERLLNTVMLGTRVHIDRNTRFIEIYGERASYKIPYSKVSCSYLLDSVQSKLRTNCVNFQCLAKFKSGGCVLKVKYGDGWRGVTGASIAFNTKEDVYQFIELFTLVKKETNK